MAATLLPDSKITNKTVKTEITRKGQIDKERRARESLLHKPNPHLRLRTSPYRSFPLILVIPSLLHWVSRSPHVGAPQEVQPARLHLSSTSQTPTRRPLGSLVDPRPQLGRLVLPPGIVLKQVVRRLLSATDVGRTAGCVVRSVVRALRLHAREGMPGLSW